MIAVPLLLRRHRSFHLTDLTLCLHLSVTVSGKDLSPPPRYERNSRGSGQDSHLFLVVPLASRNKTRKELLCDPQTSTPNGGAAVACRLSTKKEACCLFRSGDVTKKINDEHGAFFFFFALHLNCPASCPSLLSLISRSPSFLNIRQTICSRYSTLSSPKVENLPRFRRMARSLRRIQAPLASQSGSCSFYSSCRLTRPLPRRLIAVFFSAIPRS